MSKHVPLPTDPAEREAERRRRKREWRATMIRRLREERLRSSVYRAKKPRNLLDL
jgi:hypothetical protein